MRDVQGAFIALPPVVSSLDKRQLLILKVSALLTLLTLSAASGRPAAEIGPLLALYLGVFAVVSLRQAWPAWQRLALFLGMVIPAAMIGGLDRETGNLILMATVTVKTAELRTHRDGHTMVLIAAIAQFVGLLQEQQPVVMAVGMAAMISGFAAARMLSEISHPSARTLRSSPVVSILREMMIVLPFALAVYMIIPRLDTQLWGAFSGRSSASLSEEMNVARWSALLNDLSTAFRVRFDGPVPPPSEMYFRGMTQWSFDGSVWTSTPSDPDAVLPASSPRPIASGKTRRYQITFDPKIDARIYALDYPTKIPDNARRMSDDTLISLRRMDRKSTTLRLDSAPAAPGMLTEAERRSALQLPEGFNPKTLAMAKRWRKRNPDPAAFANYALDHFRKGYVYSFDPPPVGRQAVDDFVFGTKQGFCAHYSSAYAIIMRAGGVPARVVNGYAGGEVSDLGDYLRIRQADAHAWVEVWLDGKWVRVDPTAVLPPSDGRRSASWMLANRSYEVMDWIGDIWNRWFIYFDDTAQASLRQRLSDALTRIDVRWFVFAAGSSILLVGVLFARRFRRNADQRLRSGLDRFCRCYAKNYRPSMTWQSAFESLALQGDDAKSAERLLDMAYRHFYAGQPQDVVAMRNLLGRIKAATVRRKTQE